MNLCRISKNFEGTWDEAMHQKAFYLVRELTDEEAEEFALYGCPDPDGIYR